MPLPKFGSYLIEKGYIDERDLIEALNIQRRRSLIPLGEIALHEQLISPKDLIEILDYQSQTKDKFGKIAVALGMLNQGQLQQLLKKQERLHTSIGEILVEIGSIDRAALQNSLTNFETDKEHFINEARANKRYFLNREERRKKKEEREASMVNNERDGRSPVITAHTCCPVCDQPTPQWYLSRSSYSVIKKDIDLKPIEYVWDDSQFKDLNPLFFNVWTCPHCLFSAGRLNFIEPNRDIVVTKTTLIRKFHAILEDPAINYVVSQLDPKIDYQSDLTHLSTVKQYLISIYLLNNIDIVIQRDALQLAKYHLNLAWLYREICKEPINREAITDILHLKHQLAKYWPDIPMTEKSALNLCLKYYEISIYESPVPEQNGVEHILFQQMGRIDMRLNKFTEARKHLHEGLKFARRLQQGYDKKLKNARGMLYERLYDDLAPKLGELNRYYNETMDLLDTCKSKMSS